MKEIIEYSGQVLNLCTFKLSLLAIMVFNNHAQSQNISIEAGAGIGKAHYTEHFWEPQTRNITPMHRNSSDHSIYVLYRLNELTSIGTGAYTVNRNYFKIYSAGYLWLFFPSKDWFEYEIRSYGIPLFLDHRLTKSEDRRLQFHARTGIELEDFLFLKGGPDKQKIEIIFYESDEEQIVGVGRYQQKRNGGYLLVFGGLQAEYRLLPNMHIGISAFYHQGTATRVRGHFTYYNDVRFRMPSDQEFEFVENDEYTYDTIRKFSFGPAASYNFTSKGSYNNFRLSLRYTL